MNRVEHLLFILAEECAEVAQRASKAARFGLAEAQPPESPEDMPNKTNAERIIDEFADLLGVVEMLMAEGYLRRVPREEIVAKKAAKISKISKFLAYSAAQGTLQEPVAKLAREEVYKRKAE